MVFMAPGADLPDDGVQQAVDLLEMALSRPVILEDAMLRPIAYSKQPDDIDGARLSVILHRGVQPEFLRMCQELGITTARGPIWTPEQPEWNMNQRLCIPVRHGRSLMAYLWVLTPKGSLSKQQIEVAVATASFVANALDAKRKQRRTAEQSNQMALARLLGSESDQSTLLANLATDENLPADSRVVVMVFDRPDGVELGRDGDVIDVVLGIKDHLPGTELPVRWMVHLADRPAVLAVLSADSRLDESAIAQAVQTSLSAHFQHPVVVGSGGEAVPLREVRKAYERAVTTAWVARTSARDRAATSWSQIGSWRLIARLAQTVTDTPGLAEDFHPGLARLLAEGRSDLIDTLEAYLASGSDVRATADALHLHRSTLYYRIERISEITGANLRDGETRFELMLGLRLAALLGLREDRSDAGRNRTQ